MANLEIMNGYIEKEGIIRAEGPQVIQRLWGECGNGNEEQLPGSDHASLWLNNGRPYLFVIQPYTVNDEMLRAFVQICHEHDLEIRIDARKSWHNPGRTVLVEFRKRG